MDARSALIALGISAFFILPALRWPALGRWLVALMFLGGAAFNGLYTLPNAPGSLESLVATSAVPFYRTVVQVAAGWNAAAFALLVIAFELTVGVCVLSRGPASRLGLLAAAAWSIGMLPVIPPDGVLIGVALTGAPGVAALLLSRQTFERGALAVPASAVAAGALVAALFGLYGTVLYPWLLNWGTTPAEQRMALPGDELLPKPGRYFTRAITIDAPPAVVWRWLMQIGQDRAGFYSNDYLENLAGGDIHNVDELRPEWQDRALGDRVPMARADIAGGAVGEALYLPIRGIEPERMVANLPGRFVLLPVGGGATRLLLREPLDESLFVKVVYEPLHFVMEQRMLRGIKERAEGSPLVPPLARALAQTGWWLTGAPVASLFLSRRRWAPFGVLCAALMVPSWHSTGDPSGALAGFLALGISVLGALRYGRKWPAPYAPVAAGVLLTLLLSPDSYTVFGLAFLAVGSGAGVVAMWRALRLERADVFLRPA